MTEAAGDGMRLEALAVDQPGRAHCPTDDWAFDPRYTNGVCPLCGWRPPGRRVSAPRYTQIDWFWPMVGLVAAVSVLMGVLVLIAYNS